MMTIYFAPMEGITDGILRRTHQEIFGGVDIYCLPFHKLTQSRDSGTVPSLIYKS